MRQAGGVTDEPAATAPAATRDDTLRRGLGLLARGGPPRAADLRGRGRRQRGLRRDDGRLGLGARPGDRPGRSSRPSDDGARRRLPSSAAGLAIVGCRVLKAAGIVARRLGAGVMQYRLQASYRREVTRQYLRLPLSWHQRHPTGQLLSNANADVEAVWFPIAPLPMAVGVLVMLVVAGVALVLTDPVLSLVGLPRLPGDLRAQRRLPAQALAAGDPGAAAARRGQRGRARVLRRRAGGQDAGPRGRGDRAVRRLGRRAARRADRGRPGPGDVRPGAGGVADARACSRCCGSARRGWSQATSRRATWCRSPTSSPSSRSRSGPSAGCSASCRAASSGGTGCPGCSTPPAA